jgi:hypothetical protein
VDDIRRFEVEIATIPSAGFGVIIGNVTKVSEFVNLGRTTAYTIKNACNNTSKLD